MSRRTRDTCHRFGRRRGAPLLLSYLCRCNVMGCERAGAASWRRPEARLLEHLSFVRQGHKSGAQRGMVGHHAAQQCLAASSSPGGGHARLDLTCCAVTKRCPSGHGAVRSRQALRPTNVAHFASPWPDSEAGTAPRNTLRVPIILTARLHHSSLGHV